MFFEFIQPCQPQGAKTMPAGDDWQQEINFDRFRVQIQKRVNEVELYSRSGSRFGVKWRGWPTAVQWLERGLVVAGIAGAVSARDTERSPQSDNGTA